MIIPVILAGGSGTRLWPLSRSSLPKQFLSLISSYTMLQETLLRFKERRDFASPIIICHHDHRFIVAEQLKQIGITQPVIILEPVGKNTAPAATIAALYAKKYLNNSLILLLPADHMIREDSALIAAIDAGKRNALEGKIVTFGITPNYPATGYGYIKISKKVNEHQGFEVLQFVEKPPLDKAKAFFASQEYYWNSGMFLFEPSHLLTEMQAHAPEIVSSCQKSFQNMREDLDFLRLDQEEFTACPNQSIDYAIMEKTKRGVLIPLSVEWSDVGSWISLDEIQPKDENNNILQGDVSQQNVENTYIRADHRLVVAIGIKNQIIVETKDVILIADKSQIDILKERMEHLKNEDRHEVDSHSRVYQPWGYHEIIEKGEGYLVKRIVVKPEASLSLQSHQHRSEHWVVVRGIARVTRGEENFILKANQSTYIGNKVKHRLANAGRENLEVIEVQSGVYLGEEDIVRYEDAYGRSIAFIS